MWGQVQSRVLLIIPVAGAIIPRVERLTLGRQVALSSHTFHPWQSLGPGILTLRYMPRFIFPFHDPPSEHLSKLVIICLFV